MIITVSMKDEADFKWKQCLIIRSDVKMTCGKNAHNSLMLLLVRMKKPIESPERSGLTRA